MRERCQIKSRLVQFMASPGENQGVLNAFMHRYYDIIRDTDRNVVFVEGHDITQDMILGSPPLGLYSPRAIANARARIFACDIPITTVFIALTFFYAPQRHGPHPRKNPSVTGMHHPRIHTRIHRAHPDPLHAGAYNPTARANRYIFFSRMFSLPASRARNAGFQPADRPA